MCLCALQQFLCFGKTLFADSDTSHTASAAVSLLSGYRVRYCATSQIALGNFYAFACNKHGAKSGIALCLGPSQGAITGACAIG
jgi:hypothetical protein